MNKNESIPKLDKIDYKILHELDKDARIDISKLAKRLQLSRIVVDYRIKKMLEQGLIRSFSSFIDPAKFGLSSWKVYLKFQNLQPNTEKEMILFLQKQKEVWWIARCRGKYDLLYSALGESFYEFNQILEQFHSQFGEYILEEALNNHLEPQYFSRGYLSNQASVNLCSPFLSKPNKEKIDAIDLNILRELNRNCRQKVTELARKLKLTAKIVMYRIKELQRKKIIVMNRLNLNSKKLGLEFYKGLIYLKNTSPQNMMKLKEFIKQNKYLNELVKSVGPWQMEIEAEVKSFSHFNEIIDELRLNFPEIIIRIEPLLIYEEFNSEFNFLRD